MLILLLCFFNLQANGQNNQFTTLYSFPGTYKLPGDFSHKEVKLLFSDEILSYDEKKCITTHKVSFTLTFPGVDITHTFYEGGKRLTGHQVMPLKLEGAFFFLLRVYTIPDIAAGPLSETIDNYLLRIDEKSVTLARAGNVPLEHELDYKTVNIYYPEKDCFLIENICMIYNPETRKSERLYSFWFQEEVKILDSYVAVRKVKLGTVTDDRLRVREDVDLSAIITGYLNSGDVVFIREQSEEEEKIGEMEAYWLRVYLPEKNLQGWSYGYYLEELSMPGW